TQRQDVVHHVVTTGDLVKHSPDVAGPLIQTGLRHHVSPVVRSGLSRETAPQILTYRTPNRPFRVISRQVAARLAWVPRVSPSRRSGGRRRWRRWPRLRG